MFLVGLYLFFFFQSFVFADITLTDKEYDRVIQRLEKDKKIIDSEQLRWDKLRKAIPVIEYEIIENGIVVQKITIPIDIDTPLEYRTTFEVNITKQGETLTPFTFRLVGVVETSNITDFKLGCKILSLSPFKISYLQMMGLNVLVGIRSFGLSASYDLPKPFKNTSFHLYYGFDYKLSAASAVYGLGVGLNF